MANTEIPCAYFSNTGGCSNHEAAGNNAGETSSILHQPWSCHLALHAERQKFCSGYTPESKTPSVIEAQVKRIG